VRVGNKVTLLVPQLSANIMGIQPRFKRFTVSGIFDAGIGEYDNNTTMTIIETILNAATAIINDNIIAIICFSRLSALMKLAFCFSSTVESLLTLPLLVLVHVLVSLGKKERKVKNKKRGKMKDKNVEEKQKAKKRKSGQKVFKFISKMMLKTFRKAKSQ
jgi:hypothetical protein